MISYVLDTSLIVENISSRFISFIQEQKKHFTKKYSSKELKEAYYLNSKPKFFSSFEDDIVYIEKFVEKLHHIEFQIFSDKYGNVTHLYEQEYYSIQHKSQKITEESPSPFIRSELCQKMGKETVGAIRTVDYIGARSIEFLANKNQNFFFWEMNIRLQVKHPKALKKY
ncbi:MAG: hypothetical protein Pg6B_01180 [Candidatus Azobacteroides pseudotrichonymphae]|jgi:acetyl-CoA carboxylase biotin carboxylase subunit|nr:hypothetical protein [Bacteroidales bacterium OttesenSCG-928-I14]GMO32457.1 MAG: hypothetical protein Pg6B_01180 [Candidatus Azobacteroides pseudotrichonymphae]